MTTPPNKKQFAVIPNRDYTGDLAVGAWNEIYRKYEFGDCDLYTQDGLERLWPETRFLSWTEMARELGRK